MCGGVPLKPGLIWCNALLRYVHTTKALAKRMLNVLQSLIVQCPTQAFCLLPKVKWPGPFSDAGAGYNVYHDC